MRDDVGDLTVVVNDASCLIDLRKGKLLHWMSKLPFRLLIPYPVRASELLQFTAQEWALIDSCFVTFDLTPDLVLEAMLLKQRHPRLSANDCFCLVSTRHHPGAVLLTGDRTLRQLAEQESQRVHGVLWVVDELRRNSPDAEPALRAAIECWLEDPTVRLPARELQARLAGLR